MKLYDLSQEVFSCRVYAGDPVPQYQRPKSTANGDLYNLTTFAMCAHNGTHADAPFHFLHHGKTIDQLGLEPFVGMSCVVSHQGEVSAADASEMMKKAQQAGAAERILIRGDVVVSTEAAEVFAEAGVLLLGVESQSVGPEEAPMAAHLALLGAGAALLEGLRMTDVPEGVYLLSAAPLNLGGADGAPCRAVLMDLCGASAGE